MTKAGENLIQAGREAITMAKLMAENERLRNMIAGPDWQLVPIEPTSKMLFEAAHLKGVLAANKLIKPNSDELYRAMLAAAPDPLGDG